MPYDLAIPSVKNSVSAEEWQVRVDLAAAYRLVALYGMTDMIANHISARVPGEEGAFLINPYGMFYEEITASSLLKIDIDGNILFKPDFEYGVNRAGFVIHSAIHAARHDIACIVHTHTAAGMAVSCMKEGLLPMTQTAMRFANVTYHKYEGVATELEERARLVADLGTSNSMVLYNHGLLAMGPSIPEAFNNIHRMELACLSQVMAMSSGAELVMPDRPVIDKTYENYKPGGKRRAFGLLEWPGLLRKLDRLDPSYRD